MPRHATSAKEFTFCRCAELRPAPLTCANLLIAATTTCSFLTVRSRLYQRQPISASSQPSATWALVIWLQSFTMDKCLIPQPRRCVMRFWQRLINDSQLVDMEDLPAQTYLEHCNFRETPTPVRVLGTTTMAFGQGTDVTGGYLSCPAVQCGATVTSGLTATRPCCTRRLAWTGAAAGVHQVSVTTRFDMCHSLAPEPKTNITECLGII